MNNFLHAYIILFHRKLSAVFIIFIESMNKVNFFLGQCFTLFQGKLSKYPLLLLHCFISLVDQIKYCETPKHSEQYFHDQESGTKVNICNFSVFEVVINFSVIAECSLSRSSTLFLVSLSYIGNDSSISISETLYAAEMFSLHTFKNFFNLPFVFGASLCWANPWILTGKTPMLSRVELSFFFGDPYSKKSSSGANSSCELSASIFLSCSHFQVV